VPERYDIDEIKRKLTFSELCASQGVELRRSGRDLVGICPFHGERSGSFTVHGPEFDHGHCYGCGWNGDHFDFWLARHGGTLAEAIAAVARLCSALPSHSPGRVVNRPKVTEKTADDVREKPALPRLRALTQAEVEQLAALRKLSVAGVAAAAADKRVGACMWPQWQDDRGYWRVPADAAPCWVVTDGARNVAQFRRLDGMAFVRKDGKKIKAWTKGSPTWPLGAAELGDRVAVLLVEGGADMLAAYHFLELFRRRGSVAVCAMLGASMRIRSDALPLFRRRRVRIIMDEDEPDERGARPGYDAAARWTEQLCSVGAAVESFSLRDLVRKDGKKVKDLNDLAEVDEAAWLDPELSSAFINFEF